MDHIETAILNCYGIREAEQNMVFAARLTQHGHTIQNMADLMDLLPDMSFHEAAWQQKDWYVNFHRLTPVIVVKSMPL